jgi:hypothetical protein
LGLYKPVNISSLLVSAAYQKLDELECAESTSEKQQICELLLRVLPILKTQILEELLGENTNLSALVVLGYDVLVEKFRNTGRRNWSSSINAELTCIRDIPLVATLDSDVSDDDEDVQYSCCLCKYILFNTRRSCGQCKAYDLCETCYNKVGRHHPHKMKKHRKIAVQSLLDLIESIRVVLSEHEQDERIESRSTRKRERREIKMDASQDHVYEEEVIDCICGNNKDLGFMISCEKCFAWLHGKCVGISKRNEPEMYYCPRCSKKKPMIINTKLSPKDVTPEEKLREYNLM